MKTTITCLIVALFWNIAATQQVSKFYSVSKDDPPWLHLCYNGDNTIPERTVIYTSRRPSIRQVRPSMWEITFPPLP